MLYSSCIRRVIVQAGIFCKTRLQLGNVGRSLNASRGVNCKWNRQIFTMSSVSMMVDSVSTAKRGPTADLLTGEDDDGGFVCRGWKSEEGELSCGYSSFRGKRVTMEDFFDVKNTTIDGQRVCMFGIFDGHGGSRAAEYLKEHLFENLLKHPQFITDTKLALSESYQQTDVDFLDSEKDTYRDDGSTASTAVLVGDHLYVANVGDSRTVISKGGKAIPLSEDHKPNRSDERKRIESAGGVVMWAGTWRVGGVLAMSRAFGNRMLKQFVVAEPEIQEQKIDEEFELLVLASDGLWDVVPNEDAVSIARTEEPEAAARKLTEAAFTRGSADNITCIVVQFHHDKTDPRLIHPISRRIRHCHLFCMYRFIDVLANLLLISMHA
ncbi:hypothetical protein BDE02_12G009700 [Populus trichocarpa]|nr:hypothetical protein BDE02_12G009700 [Populus trichocarpa]KAI5568352.1 hypothetical protein BDE02_12G009700 [Populus trichocarpa]KAI5568353.1 hypothetical protein BDE02_12G009700 [Populus trichocarpa]